ncbi:unnamed protein product [Cuscuta europaea]|uniref:Uncharacterized protein n=1 Tax=Cuscuta europaea TaxID=41803 RepID=A0A9P1DWU8_CUSEU|nr:unnamed protein product [Cuscuta europaea]
MDYGSGCESGWTMYLENSLIPPCTTYSHGNEFLHKSMINKQEEEEEDLSMISDASSGPPQVFGEEEFGLCYDNYPIDAALLLPAKVDAKSHKKKPNRREKLKEKASSALDDTASSPIFTSTHNNFSQNNNHSSGENVVVPGFSHGYSTTQFHGQSTHHQEHSELFQLQPNQWFERRWGY